MHYEAMKELMKSMNTTGCVETLLDKAASARYYRQAKSTTKLGLFYIMTFAAMLTITPNLLYLGAFLAACYLTIDSHNRYEGAFIR